jgi:hypothetical protein
MNNISEIFNLKRLYNLILIELKSNAKSILIVSATIIVFLALLPFVKASNEDTYFTILYLGGFIVTSRIFNDLHDPVRAPLFLMLPCSNLERFLSKWFLSSIGYALGTLLVFYLFSLSSALLNLFIYKHPLAIMHGSLWIGIWKYSILQSLVLLGAITFKKYSLLKTTLVLACIFLAFTVFSFFVTLFIFLPSHLPQGAAMVETSLTGGNFIFWIIMAPICWYITYLRLSEYELR